MGRKYVFHDSKKLYFVSFATVSWIDVFVRQIYFQIVIESIKYCIGNKWLEVYAWCIMPSQVHLIISSEKAELSDIMRDLKRHTSKKLLSSIQLNIQESRKEWMLWIACPASTDLQVQVKKILTMIIIDSGSKIIIQ